MTGTTPTNTDPRVRLLRAIAWALLAAAIVSAPGFLIAEGFEARHVARIAASNGLTAIGAILLLRASSRGGVAAPARILVYGLLALVAWLAATGSEEVHVNVVNFTLVVVLAATLLGRTELVLVGALSAAALVAIAREQARSAESLIESVAQFLPTFLVIVFVLWIALPARKLAARADPSPAEPE